MADIYLVTFVKRGKNRLKILKLLAGKEKTQAELHKESGMYRTHVRRTLLELQEKDLVKCLNPRDRIYKLYKVTTKGNGVLRKLKS
jgi:DNA-binding IclR family transcriptional regulator